MIKVFVTYSWDSESHKNKVLSFCDFLIKKKFDASIDRKESQEELSIDFNKMMHQAMTDNEKVIIVLSEGYKAKAEKFLGGVGFEYSLIINDIKENPLKYLLVSFDGIDNKILPLSFKGREVVDLGKKEGMNILFAKLQGKNQIEFSKVSEQLPEVESKPIPDFESLMEDNYTKESLKKDNYSLSESLDFIFISVNNHKDPNTEKLYKPKLNNETQVVNSLELKKIQISKSQGNVLINGMSFTFFTLAGSGAYEIKIAPALLLRNLDLLKDILTISFNEEIVQYQMELNFKKNYRIEIDLLKISSRIFNSQIALTNKHGEYIFKGDNHVLNLKISGSKQIKLLFHLKYLNYLPIEELLEELSSIKILTKKN